MNEPSNPEIPTVERTPAVETSDRAAFAKLGTILALALAASFQLTLFGFALLDATTDFTMSAWGWGSLAIFFLVSQLAFLATLIRLNAQNKNSH